MIVILSWNWSLMNCDEWLVRVLVVIVAIVEAIADLVTIVEAIADIIT